MTDAEACDATASTTTVTAPASLAARRLRRSIPNMSIPHF
jgi:hypothetical protein